jgi:Fe-S oxidoreductase/nitrate reductase gamma subunit
MAVTEQVAKAGIERLPMWDMYGGVWAYTRWIIYALSIPVMVIFAYGVWLRIKAYRVGRQAEGALDQPALRVGELLKYWIAQLKVLKETYQGLFHLLLFWGFVVLFIGTATTVLDEDVWQLFGGEKFIRNDFYVIFSFLLTLFGVLALGGVILAFWRRYVMKPKGLDNQQEDATLLIWIFLILLTGFLSQGARIGVMMGEKGNVAYEASRFVGYGLAGLFGNHPALHKLFWSLHAALSLGFIAALPYNKARHILTTGASIFTHSLKPKGKIITPIPNMMARMEAGEEVELGYKRLEQLTWREILQLDACTRCGRCQDQCPAYNTGKHLSPKQFIQDVKSYWQTKTAAALAAQITKNMSPEVHAEAAADLAKEGVSADGQYLLKVEAAMQGDDEKNKGAISSAVLWDCTNCMACMNACPVMIEHVPLITAMRRELAMEFDDSEAACKSFFKNMDTNANPWGWNPADRAKWAAEDGVPTIFDNPDYEYLLFIGCMGAFDPKAIKANRAFVQILKEAGVSFAILGEAEMCCGDSIRRLGNEASFQAIVMMFQETVKGLELDPTFKGKKVVTLCPHGYNCLKHEYPDFGFQWQVVHYTELLTQLLAAGKIKMKGGNGKSAVYHDSCFLSRYNDIMAEPRSLLAAAGFKVMEPERRELKTFCCGAGGGRVWLEEHIDEANGVFRINNNRCDEMVGVGADNIVTACPFCGMMFDESCKRPSLEKAMEGKRLVDLAELVKENMVFTPKTES